MDGFCAAWVIRKVYPNAEFQEVSYQQPPPDVTGRNVLVVDFSYKRPVLEEMKSKAQYLRVFDHHKTAWEDLASLEYCYFDGNKSGARIAWDIIRCSPWAVKNPDTPPIVLYIEDRDLWKFQLPHSKEVNAALSSYPKDFKVWDELEKKDINEFIIEGTAILRYQTQIVDFLSDQAEEIEIGGHKVLAVNSPVLQSEIGNKLAHGRPFGAVWYEQKGKRKFSLRSTNQGVDVAEVAQQQGGGGHRNASGFMENI
jgi:oligoribonuclease NrnB/cAMP/cGMP phosphodiesterase (DHH superfamily)